MGALALVADPPTHTEPVLTLVEEFPDDEWVARLSATGPIRTAAIERLHALLRRASAHQVNRMPQADDLGAVRRDEIITAAANEATVAVLARLDRFEGRSRFSTWVYKFGIYQAGVEVRRAAWSDREVQLHDLPVADPDPSGSPETHAEARDLATVLNEAMLSELTTHQRRIAIALLVDSVPIDVLAERLGTSRGALYKTLHDVRRRLRTHLMQQGLIDPTRETNR